MDVKWLPLLIILQIIIPRSDSARILCAYAAPFFSHQLVFRRLTMELLKRGHELVVVTPFPTKTENLTEIDVYDVSIKNWDNFKTIISSDAQDLNKQKLKMLGLITNTTLSQLLHPEVQKLLYSDLTFDVIIVESGCKLTYIYGHIFKAPIIAISSLTAALDDFEVFGAPTQPFLYPPSMPKRIYNLTFSEKVIELYGYFLFKYSYIQQEKIENALLKRHFGEDIPDIEKLRDRVEMLFLNVHRIWEGNRPVPPNIVYLGGLHQTPEKELPMELKSYLDSSQNGVIYMSFGSAVSSALFPPDKIKVFLNVFRKLPYDILWKWEADEFTGVSDNIKYVNWVPQADLLRHPKVKLFITQSGLQSTDEAITAGVPMVGIPMLGDQWYSAEKYVHHGIGTMLDFVSLDEAKLRGAIETVLNNKSYYTNIVKLREQMYDQPETSLQRAVWWTEHVLRHGGARHLRAPAANMPWAQYYELELVAYLLACLVGLLVVGDLIVYFMYRFVRRVISRQEKIKRS